ncbi:MAG: hypothetical protein H7Y00_02385 [Fimbriimonadaceae bacterium]|nr:hypothetical protein [Chitinophagales bacterium]
MFAASTYQNKNIASKKQDLFFQPKLEINNPDDRYEKEADAVAEQVVQGKSGNNSNTFFRPVRNKIQKSPDENGELKHIDLRLRHLPKPSIIYTGKNRFDIPDLSSPSPDTGAFRQIYLDRSATLKYRESDVLDIHSRFLSFYLSAGMRIEQASGAANSSTQAAIDSYLEYDNPDLFNTSNYDFGAIVIPDIIPKN